MNRLMTLKQIYCHCQWRSEKSICECHGVTWRRLPISRDSLKGRKRLAMIDEAWWGSMSEQVRVEPIWTRISIIMLWKTRVTIERDKGGGENGTWKPGRSASMIYFSASSHIWWEMPRWSMCSIKYRILIATKKRSSSKFHAREHEIERWWNEDHPPMIWVFLCGGWL